MMHCVREHLCRGATRVTVRAVQLVGEIRDVHDSALAALGQVARLLGIGSAEDLGSRPGATTQ